MVKDEMIKQLTMNDIDTETRVWQLRSITYQIESQRIDFDELPPLKKQ